jgi:hypothetical protein
MVHGFESPYTELASLLKNNVRSLDSSITQHSVEAKAIFPHKNRRPLEISGTLGYAHEGGKYYDSDDGIAFLSFDFSYDNFVLQRTCAVGCFAGAVKNGIDYRYDHIAKGRLQMGFAGYYCNVHIRGFDISTTSILGLGSSHTDCKNLNLHGINCDHFTHHHRIFHSKIDIYYPWQWHNYKVGPNVALRTDNLKQNGAKEWQQDTLRLQSTDAIAGIKCEKDSPSLYAHLFLGAERNIREHWSGGAIAIDGFGENFTRSALDRTQFLVTAGIHFRYTESFFINLHYSGRHGPRHKSSTFGLTLNKIF